MYPSRQARSRLTADQMQRAARCGRVATGTSARVTATGSQRAGNRSAWAVTSVVTLRTAKGDWEPAGPPKREDGFTASSEVSHSPAGPAGQTLNHGSG